VRPSSGPHSLEKCLPLAVVLRDVLGFAQTRKEAKTIVSEGKIHVDGKTIRKDNFPVSLMDVISIPDADQHFRVMPSRKGLVLHPIGKEEATFKLYRIENKAVTENGHVQLNLHDGSNILVKVADPKNPQEDTYQTLDTIKLSVPDRQILECVKMKEKDLAIITGGKNIGKYGKIVEIESAKAKKRRNALTVIEDERGNRYQTILNFVFAVGEEQPIVTLPEATAID
jgi:small subunit ribosomal protein S4e